MEVNIELKKHLTIFCLGYAPTPSNFERWRTSKRFLRMSAILWLWKNREPNQQQEHRRKSFYQIQGFFLLILKNFRISKIIDE